MGLLAMAVLMAIGLGGCKNAPEYGDIEGSWQIMSVTDADGTKVEIPGRRYISMELNVVQLRTETDVVIGLTGNLTYNEPVLTWDFPYQHHPEIHPAHHPDLAHWGIETNPVSFTVTEVNRKHLVMHTADGRRWECRRF